MPEVRRERERAPACPFPLRPPRRDHIVLLLKLSENRVPALRRATRRTGYAASARRRYQIEPLNFIVACFAAKNAAMPSAIQAAASASAVLPLSTAAITFVCVSR